jgi:hypothetical protein
MKGLFNDRELDEKAAKQLADKRRDQLRRDLKKQMDEKKRLDEQAKRDNEDIPNTGLPIGQEYVNRYDRFRDAHKAALKGQIDEKKRQHEQDKELDKKLQDQYAEDMKDLDRVEKERKKNADQARRDHYKQEMERFMAEKDLKKNREDDEKARDLENDQLNKQRERDQERAREEAVKRREDNHLAALKDQMDEAARRKVTFYLNRNSKRRSARNIKFQHSRQKRSASCMTAQNATRSILLHSSTKSSMSTTTEILKPTTIIKMFLVVILESHTTGYQVYVHSPCSLAYRI